MLLYSTLRYSTLLYATLRYSTLLYATLRYSTLLYATLRYSTLLYATLRYSTLLYATLRYSTLLYATLRYSTLLYATLRYSTLLYATLLAIVGIAFGYQNLKRNTCQWEDIAVRLLMGFIYEMISDIRQRFELKVETCRRRVIIFFRKFDGIEY